jgi:hypothetical protein
MRGKRALPDTRRCAVACSSASMFGSCPPPVGDTRGPRPALCERYLTALSQSAHTLRSRMGCVPTCVIAIPWEIATTAVLCAGSAIAQRTITSTRDAKFSAAERSQVALFHRLCAVIVENSREGARRSPKRSLKALYRVRGVDGYQTSAKADRERWRSGARGPTGRGSSARRSSESQGQAREATLARGAATVQGSEEGRPARQGRTRGDLEETEEDLRRRCTRGKDRATLKKCCRAVWACRPLCQRMIVSSRTADRYIYVWV